MELFEQLVYPINQTAILAIVGVGFLCRQRYRLALVLLALGAAWLWLCATPAMAIRLRETMERGHPPQEASAYPKADAIVVLGGGVVPHSGFDWNADDSYSLTTRIGFGLQLFRDARASVVLLSGDDQAPRMARVLQQQGVPLDAMRTEHASMNTHENAMFSAAMLKREKLTRILLVTSTTHMRRAAAAFAKQGLDVIPAPAYDPDRPSWQAHPWRPTRSALRLSGRCLREYVGLWWYRMRGWA